MAEGLSQNPFFLAQRSVFHGIGNPQSKIYQVQIQERNPGLHPESSRHPIPSLQSGAVQRLKQIIRFRLPFLFRQVFHIRVTAEEFVGTFPGKRHLTGLRCHPGKKIVGDGAPHQCGIIGFKVVDDRRQHFQHFFQSVNVFMVLRSEVFGAHPGMKQIFALFHAYGKGIHPVPLLRSQRGYDAAVQPAAQIDAEGVTALDSLVYRIL